MALIMDHTSLVLFTTVCIYIAQSVSAFTEGQTGQAVVDKVPVGGASSVDGPDVLAGAAVHTCVLFHGSPDFLNRTLIIRVFTEEREFCRINDTTKIGEPVPCERGATATLLNATCVLLDIPQKLREEFLLEFGKGNERDKSAPGNIKDCPVPSTSPTPSQIYFPTQSPVIGESRPRWRLIVAAPVVTVVIIIVVIILVIFLPRYRNKSAVEERENILLTEHKDNAANGNCNGNHV
ncbi:uncharacterized protein LOC142106815 [Mixophyes fleayi]|uniref:uncharacterized protein LOC142106815 n=1 Tax=Mixophyes fleayi TaxID=3061075 RepID=UPI003F4DD69B